MFDRLLTARCGTLDSETTVLPRLRYYDWTRQLLAHPYCVYDWANGAPLWGTPSPSLYRAAGRALAQIHTVRFEAWYADFPSVGKKPLAWAERFPQALGKELDAARRHLPATLAEAAAGLRLPDALEVGPCLVHNDFSPGNILTADGRLTAIIDWDNAVVDASALDFVKMKYWTAKTPLVCCPPTRRCLGLLSGATATPGRPSLSLWPLRCMSCCGCCGCSISSAPSRPRASPRRRDIPRPARMRLSCLRC